ncbi:antitoxin [Nocardiopsis sp. CNT-189]|uniref:FitA-like ribbon-helix-helix domain-containing protein n=1 Tax=Nocardiopsis oceanisediminis TaxID=2816862 RepID=UPI003B350A12
MASLTIRDVSDEAVRTMKIRAVTSGQSLQAYLRALIEREAAKPTLAEMAERIERRAKPELTAEDVTEATDQGREGR